MVGEECLAFATPHCSESLAVFKFDSAQITYRNKLKQTQIE